MAGSRCVSMWCASDCCRGGDAIGDPSIDSPELVLSHKSKWSNEDFGGSFIGRVRIGCDPVTPLMTMASGVSGVRKSCTALMGISAIPDVAPFDA